MIEDYSVLTVNNVKLPTPSYGGYTTKKEELVSASRTITGDLVKKRVQNYLKHTITVKWVGLTKAEASLIMGACRAPSGSEYVNVVFYDLETAAFVTITAYLGSDVKMTGTGKATVTASDVTFEHYAIELSLIEK